MNFLQTKLGHQFHLFEKIKPSKILKMRAGEVVRIPPFLILNQTKQTRGNRRVWI